MNVPNGDFDRCTISMDNIKLCGDPVVDGSPVPVCFAHASQLLAFMADAFDKAVAAPHGMRVVATMADSMGRRQRAQRITESANAVVYYIQVGDMVKIGTTTNLSRRVADYPPGSRLLATEPGSYELEAQRHGQFNDCLVTGKEWFAPTRRLMAHIECLKDNVA